MKKAILGCSVGFAFSMLQGCASVAVRDDDLSVNTARALGVTPSNVVISDRRDSGVQTTYVAKANGAVYNCYVTGSIGIVGRLVSDAMCTPLASAAGQSVIPQKKSVECNALLQAAGKC